MRKKQLLRKNIVEVWFREINSDFLQFSVFILNQEPEKNPLHNHLPRRYTVLVSIHMKQEVSIMERYVCEPCGYVYDPEVGDPDNGIEPGTAFADLPDDWVCPVCGLGKDVFVVEE